MNLSHSSVGVYEECPGRWRLKYVEKLPEKPRHYFSLGNSVHKALEFMYGGLVCPPLSAVAGALLENWRPAGYKDAAHEAKSKKEALDMVQAYYLKHAAGWRKPLAVELKFNMEFGGVPVTGYVDRVDEEPGGGLRVIDYKTGRMWEEPRAPVDEQLMLYQVAVEAATGRKVHYLEFQHVPSLAVDMCARHGTEAIGRLADKFARVAAGITAQQYPYTPSEDACKFCDYKAQCPEWTMEEGA